MSRRIQIVEVEGPDVWPAAGAFIRDVWPDRPTSPAYVRWRYEQAPGLTGRLAMRGDEPLACLFAFRRAHTTGEVLETHEWFCRPELRGSGLGIRVMRDLMKRTTVPIVAWGGSSDTLHLLPRLGWQHVGAVAEWVLPLGGPRLAARLVGDRWAEPAGRLASLVTSGVLRALPSSTPTEGEVRPGRPPEASLPDIVANTGGWGLQPSARELDWLTAAPPEHGAVSWTTHTVGGEVVGFSGVRWVVSEGSRDAVLVELAASPKHARWVVNAAIVRSLAERPDRILARSALEGPVRDALAQHGFQHRASPPVHVWSAEEAVRPGMPRGTRLAADLALLPYGVTEVRTVSAA